MNCDAFSERIVTGNRTRQLLTYNKWIEIRVDELANKASGMDPECIAKDMIINCHTVYSDSVCDVSCLLIVL